MGSADTAERVPGSRKGWQWRGKDLETGDSEVGALGTGKGVVCDEERGCLGDEGMRGDGRQDDAGAKEDEWKRSVVGTGDGF